MRIAVILVAAAAAWFAAVPAQAEFVGRVVRVQDGDTLTLLVERREVRVRLEGIDAPEMGQPFGRRARESLAELCGARTARVGELGKDRYGRVLGRIRCGEIDAAGEQVRRGLAWVYVRYAPPGSPLFDIEREARLAGRGLWSDPAAAAPWDWRRLRK
ncbi:MAG TPA: thermonuclease family protein [Burkholderiales bacterium]|nr:thermonuclease family protein [Burkholderiales bacterium]